MQKTIKTEGLNNLVPALYDVEWPVKLPKELRAKLRASFSKHKTVMICLGENAFIDLEGNIRWITYYGDGDDEELVIEVISGKEVDAAIKKCTSLLELASLPWFTALNDLMNFNGQPYYVTMLSDEDCGYGYLGMFDQ